MGQTEAGSARDAGDSAERDSRLCAVLRHTRSADANPRPPLDALREHRRAPHLFTEAQLRLILRRIKTLRPWRTELRPLTYRTLIGLLACSGLRPSEALRLRDADFQAATGTLHVPPVKRSRGRTLPLHPTTTRALQRYQRIRRSHYPTATHFFVGPVWSAPADVRRRLDFSALVRGMVSNGLARRSASLRSTSSVCHPVDCTLEPPIGSADPPLGPPVPLPRDTAISTTRIGMCSPSPRRLNTPPVDSSDIVAPCPFRLIAYAQRSIPRAPATVLCALAYHAGSQHPHASPPIGIRSNCFCTSSPKNGAYRLIGSPWSRLPRNDPRVPGTSAERSATIRPARAMHDWPLIRAFIRFCLPELAPRLHRPAAANPALFPCKRTDKPLL